MIKLLNIINEAESMALHTANIYEFSPAFKDYETGKVYLTGICHDIDRLPNDIKNKWFSNEHSLNIGFWSKKLEKFLTRDEVDDLLKEKNIKYDNFNKSVKSNDQYNNQWKLTGRYKKQYAIKQENNIQFKNILNEGIIDQTKIDLFITQLNNKLQNFDTEFVGHYNENYLDDFLNYMNETMTEIFTNTIDKIAPTFNNYIKMIGVQKIATTIHLLPDSASTNINNSVKIVAAFDIAWAVIFPESMKKNITKAFKNRELGESNCAVLNGLNVLPKLNKNFKKYSLPRLLNVIKHEFTHYMQIGKMKKLQNHNVHYGEHGKEYYGDQMEIGAYAAQFAQMLANHKIPIEKLKDRKYMMKKYTEYNISLSTGKKLFFDIGDPISKKFWKYVYQYLEQYYKTNDKV